MASSLDWNCGINIASGSLPTSFKDSSFPFPPQAFSQSTNGCLGFSMIRPLGISRIMNGGQFAPANSDHGLSTVGWGTRTAILHLKLRPSSWLAIQLQHPPIELPPFV